MMCGSRILHNKAWHQLLSATDPRAALYRMKKVRDHAVFERHRRLFRMRHKAEPMNAHGGLRVIGRLAHVRAVEGRHIHVDSLLVHDGELENPAVMDTICQLNLPAEALLVSSKDLILETVGVEHSGPSLQVICAFPTREELDHLEPPFLILDGLGSPENLGAIIRTAAAMNVRSVVSSKGSFKNVNSRCARVSMGSCFFMRFATPDEGHSLADLVRRLRSRCHIYAAETVEAGATKAIHSHPDPNWALVIGNEDTGISDDVLSEADDIVYIPQSLCVDSLNVGHAAAVCLYELCRSRTV